MNKEIAQHVRELEERVREFDRYEPFTGENIRRGIEEHRKGLFAVRLVDKDGEPIRGAKIKAVQKTHAFKFGCALFLLDQFPEEKRNLRYREEFKRIFNYGIVPLYWNTLEPEQGKLRFDKNCENIYRRPALDLVHEYCLENHIRMKGHCLMYNAFNPDWLPEDRRSVRMAVDKRSREIAERYGEDFVDLDVINEMFTVYKNTYGTTHRKFPICDDKMHAKWAFDTAKKYFPFSTLFWNEGCFETFGKDSGQYCGDKSVYYLMLKRHLAEGVPIEGIGMQFHAFENDHPEVYNALRLNDVFDTYSEFGLPIHISEVSLPSWSNDKDCEVLQAELVKRMYSLWFSRKNIESIVWWNMVDGTAYGDENRFFAGLLRNDMSHKPAYDALDELLHRTWHTEADIETNEDGIAVFNGFYGDYDITVGAEAPTCHTLSFTKENTGYHHFDFRLRTQTIVG